jgi:hypothetical protein
VVMAHFIRSLGHGVKTLLHSCFHSMGDRRRMLPEHRRISACNRGGFWGTRSGPIFTQRERVFSGWGVGHPGGWGNRRLSRHLNEGS